MLPCQKCAYRRHIPGNCHIRCVYDWAQDPAMIATFQEENQVSDHARKWFSFPFNYDPCWGADQCEAFSEIEDKTKIEKPDPLRDLLSLLR